MANYTDGGLYLWNKTDQKITTIEETAKSMQKINDSFADIATNLILYGCLGDGVSDDTTKIQNAINLGHPVLIPKGKTFLCSSLNIPNGTILFGEGTLKQKDTNAILILSSVGNIQLKGFTVIGQTVDSSVITANQSSAFEISGLTMTGSINVDGNCSAFTVKENVVNGSITINGNSKNVEVLNNETYGSSNNGISFFTQIEKGIIRGNYCHNHALNGIQLHSTINSICSENICESNTQSGIGVNNAQTNLKPSDLVISNNVCMLNGYDGIDIYNGDTLSNLRLVIEGNQSMLNTGTGIFLSYASLCLVASNVCKGNGKQGILLNQSSFNTIQGNVCFANGANELNTMSGLCLQDSSKNTVSGNLSTNQGSSANQKYGIQEIGTSDYNLFNGNTTFNNATAELIQKVGVNTKMGTNQPG